MPNRLTEWTLEQILGSAALNAEFDNIYTGNIDRSGGRLGHLDDVPITFGSSQDAQIIFATAQTPDCLSIGVDTTSRILLICDKGDETTNFSLSARANPCIIIHGPSASAHDYTEYSSHTILMHDDDLAHGMTDVASTDTYARIENLSPNTNGGLLIQGFTANISGVYVQGNSNVDDALKTTGALAPIVLVATKRSGTGTGAIGSDANAVVMRNGGTTVFIFDAEGSAHAEIEWIAFDDHDDIALCRDFQNIVRGFGESLTYNREQVEAAGLAHFDERPGRAMVNFTRLAQLHHGAIGQLAQRLEQLEQKLLNA